jgi:hypothetical protein
MDEKTKIKFEIANLIMKLQNQKPQERSEEARNYSIVITELQKVLAFYTYFIENPSQQSQG